MSGSSLLPWCVTSNLSSQRHVSYVAALATELFYTISLTQHHLSSDHLLPHCPVLSRSILDWIMKPCETHGRGADTLNLHLPHSLPVPHRRTWVHGTCVAAEPSGSCRRYVEGMLDEHGMKMQNLWTLRLWLAMVMTKMKRKRALKNIAPFDALWTRVSSWLHGGQTLLSPRTVWRGPWRNLQSQTSLRRNVFCDICVVRWISG